MGSRSASLCRSFSARFCDFWKVPVSVSSLVVLGMLRVSAGAERVEWKWEIRGESRRRGRVWDRHRRHTDAVGLVDVANSRCVGIVVGCC
jgi:hypothetical protein